jgi:hypothetical protein
VDIWGGGYLWVLIDGRGLFIACWHITARITGATFITRKILPYDKGLGCLFIALLRGFLFSLERIR